LAVITGLGREGTVDGALLGLRGAGWRVLRRPRLGSGHLDHVVLGPGGLFLILVRSGRLRPEWAQEAKAQAELLARLTGREATPLIVLNRAGGWTAGARPLHGVEVLPIAQLADHLIGRGRVLSPAATGALYAGLRLALAA
jgi:hypothetical protein